MRRLFADRLVLATGVIVILMSIHVRALAHGRIALSSGRPYACDDCGHRFASRCRDSHPGTRW